MMQQNENGLVTFHFNHLAAHADLQHAVFARRGGNSTAPYDSLNIGLSVGDRAPAVQQNRRLLSRWTAGGRVVYARQNHGSNVLVFAADPSVADAVSANATLLEGDAMVTDIPELFLAVQVADCQPILLYDPVKRVVAAIHSGWRGSAQNISARTVAVMRTAFGCRSTEIQAGIGPSLGPCCAEFINYRRELPAEFLRYRVGHNHFDFWAISRDQLNTAGIPADHIQTTELCTRCRTDLFYSYRGEKTTGRFAAVIGMKPA